jgi:predicted DsbA family dithiol-disulfide isomerase
MTRGAPPDAVPKQAVVGRTGTVDVYADIWCPFAHVSLLRAKTLRDRLAPEVPFAVRAWPLELVNGAPLDPDVTAKHVSELKRDVAPDLFSGFVPERMPRSTLKALALVEVANDVNPWLGERISLHLRDLLFERGKGIDETVLRCVAGQNGLDESAIEDVDRVAARLDEGRRRGVEGSPHYFIGERELFCPLLDVESDTLGRLQLRERLDRLERFLSDGLGVVHRSHPSTCDDKRSVH